VARCVALVVALVVASCCSAQKVSITVADMPLPEVVKLLKDMTGVDIVGDVRGGGNPARITLDLTDVPLKAVIKELCRQAGKHYGRFGRGYNLMPGAEEDSRPRCTVGAYEVILNRVSVQRTRAIDFHQAGPRTTLQYQLSIELAAEADDDAAMVAVAGFHPDVTAETDTGAMLEPLQRDFHEQGRGSEPTVQAWISLQPPPENAKSIAALEGDLVLYAQVDRAEFEFGIDEIGATKEANGTSVKLVAFSHRPPQAEYEVRIPVDPAERAPGRWRWIRPQFETTLLDAAGKAAISSGSGYSGGQEGNVYTYSQTCSFRLDAGFEPAKLRYTIAVPRDPSDRQAYLFENIPLPLEEDVPPPVDKLP
jgi:hypothetical protein